MENHNTQANNANTKSIFTPFVARRLLKMGNTIVDIKPNKDNRDKTIFVFKNTSKLQEDLKIATKHDAEISEQEKGE